ncbi:MAG TPA: NADH-quinone oxidoreductase subunit NuoG, partial [Chlamydiales bacterium]|nr:NADH-quinone oxidoreductase subunit NuoG [Chlamydiales bacterium]
GKPVRVAKGTTVYHAAKEAGIHLPIFCYQDRMPAFGACRVCMVEVEKMAKPQTSCTLEATEGMVVKTETPMAVKSREEILEFLLINHPLDCPICDRGGECPLQDQVVQFGPGKSRFYEDKRHFKKPLPLGPVLMLDRERCIACARCTRFGDIVAGDHALEFIDRGYKTEVGTPDGGPAKSKYIGNTIMICPVGALTSEVYRFRARPWDNTSRASTCTLCPVGCSMMLDSRDGEIVRTRSCENRSVNDIWLCDKGWFGYEFSNSPDRLTTPLIRREGKLEAASWQEAFSFIAEKIKAAKPNGKIAALGGNTLTVEENYLFQKLMHQACGSPHLDHRVGMPITEDGLQGTMEISIGECENLDYAILCGVDLTEEFPVIWLRLRQAINKGAKVFFLGHFAPEIARYFEKTVLHAPGKEIETLKQYMPEIEALTKSGQRGALFVGRQYVANSHRGKILKELSQLRSAQLSLNILEGKENSLGAHFAKMHATLHSRPNSEQAGFNYLQIIDTIATTGWDYLHVAGVDLANKLPQALWNEVRERLGCLVVQDIFLTKTCQSADVVLPALCFVEKEGSFINIERRVQKLKPGKNIPENSLSDGDIFTQIARELNCEISIEENFLEKLQARRLEPQFPGNYEQKIDAQTTQPLSKNTLLATFTPALFDRGVRMKKNSHLVQNSSDPTIRLHPDTATTLQIKDGQKVQMTANTKTIIGTVKLETGVARNTVVVPLGFDKLPVHEFGINLLNGLHVEIYGI